jgi:hypothetical protein
MSAFQPNGGENQAIFIKPQAKRRVFDLAQCGWRRRDKPLGSPAALLAKRVPEYFRPSPAAGLAISGKALRIAASFAMQNFYNKRLTLRS